jgi:hypothetical protein
VKRPEPTGIERGSVKKKSDKAEYAFHIEYKTIHGIENVPVKVYDPEPSPDPLTAEPRRLNIEDFIAAGLGHLIEDMLEENNGKA